MTLHQISKMADLELTKLDESIGDAEAKIKEATAEKDQAWEQVFNIIDEFDTNPRFIAPSGYTLTRQERNGTPKLNEDLLSQKLQAAMTPAAFKRLWNSITIQTVSPALVERARLAGKISPELIDACITVPPTTYARVRREWTHDDAEKALVFGISKGKETAFEPVITSP